MTTLSGVGLVIGFLALSIAAVFVIHRLIDPGTRPWLLLPAVICGQTGLGIWSSWVVPESWYPATWLLAWGLLILSLVDQIDLRLPDVVTLPLTGAGLLVAAGIGDVPGHGLGALIGYGALSALAAGYRVWRGRDGLGQGDAKLMAAAGAWLGWQALPSVVLLASAFALSGVAICRWLPTPPSLDSPIPFGPSLCLAIWIVWLYGPLGWAASA